MMSQADADVKMTTLPSDSSPDPTDYESSFDDSDTDTLAVPSEVVIIDDHGDAVIISRAEDESTHFIVCSRDFARVCEPWNAMVKCRTTTGAHANAGQLTITLENDDLYALELVLRIAHLQFDRIPISVSLRQLLALSFLTDKYQATRIVRPWLPRWLEEEWWNLSIMNKIDHIYIAWEYGLVECFKEHTSILVQDTEMHGDRTYLCFGRRLSEEEFPPGVLGRYIETTKNISYR
jgi:hypothetical protein